MNRSFDEIKERKELLGHYRAYRRGIITLPYLERGLRVDLGKLDSYIDLHIDSKLLQGFIDIAILNIETTKELVDTTIDSLEFLINYAETSGRVMDPETHARYVSENILDEEVESLILNTLHIHGGIKNLLEISHDLLKTKQQAYNFRFCLFNC